ncbi:hypothetical protein VPHD479_0358 [Vibrio phage D479]
MEFLTADDLNRMNLSEVCSLRKSLNKVLAKIRKEINRFECTNHDKKFYKRHLTYSTVVDQTISQKLRRKS